MFMYSFRITVVVWTITGRSSGRARDGSFTVKWWRKKTSVLLCSKESQWHGKIKENFGVDWLHEKKTMEKKVKELEN